VEEDSYTFDLTYEPWIPVRYVDREPREVSLRQLFKDAHQIQGFDLEFPTQEPALLRLVLACAYRIVGGPRNDDEWRQLLDRGYFESTEVDRYFDHWRDRFDLFSPETPFLQVAGLEPTSKSGVRPASALIQHAPLSNGIPLFTPITRASNLMLSPAEAARWLVERHAFGSTSDKTGAKDNPKVKAGKDAPGIGYLAWIGFIAPLGEKLFQTVLLNLVPWSRTNLIKSGENDLPSWEREPLSAARVTRPPDGVCDLFSWQGRRIRLFPERDLKGEAVVGQVLICAGDEVDKATVRNVDPHVGWRSRTTTGGVIEFVPARARQGEQVWRGLSSILVMKEGESRAGILEFFASLDPDEIRLPIVSLLITSTQFGNMSTVMVDLVSDRLETPVALLQAQQDYEPLQLAVDAVDVADKAGQILYHIAKIPYLSYDEKGKTYRVSKDSNESTAKAKAAHQDLKEEFFSVLDLKYREFLRMLGPSTDLTEMRVQWSEVIVATARRLAERHVAQLANTEPFVDAVGYTDFERSLIHISKQFLGEENN
jgi:CRISPR system Cascade subunit CasA